MPSLDTICPSVGSPKGERILVFGGSGSLGKTVLKKWIEDNQIINVSRDEEKQWSLKSHIQHTHLTQIIGDIANPDDVDHAILTTKPTIVCIFACLKHIDLCEAFPEKAMKINSFGILNVHKTLTKYTTGIHTVLFVSTDKACMPMTTYGCTKAISEFFVQHVQAPPETKWVCVRYGNVLNSSGSILPYLHSSKEKPEPYSLTHPDMTRFIMTLDQSVNLIEYAIQQGKHNEIIIPFLYSIRIPDLFELFCEKFNKTHKITGLRCKEKIHEDLLSASEANYTYQINPFYYHISNTIQSGSVQPFHSASNIIRKEELGTYLCEKGYL
jgi:FlaA1/EpsC-like NDP-sugar epimerase